MSSAQGITLAVNTQTAVSGTIGNNAYGNNDVDLYAFTAKAGQLLTVGGQNAPTYPYMRLFTASGTQLASGYWSSNPSISNFRIPADGTYYLGISSAYNYSYDPTKANSGGGSYSGPYRVSLALADSLRTSITSITSTATSGTPTIGGMASANPGQTITLNGVGFVSGDQVVFTYADDNGNISQSTVNPSSIAANGLSLQVVVPNGAVSGTVRLAREDGGIFLQVVPVISSEYINQGSQYHTGFMHLNGSGFEEGATTINFGGTQLADQTSSPYPLDVYSSGTNINVNWGVPTGADFGPTTVTTIGGTSASYGVSATKLTSTASSGTPADGSKASANPGQSITITGSGLTMSTDVVFQLADDSGNVYEYDQHPVAVAPDGSSLTVIVPSNAITGKVGIVGDLNNSALPLQIVPVVSRVRMNGNNGESAQCSLRVGLRRWSRQYVHVRFVLGGG